MKMTRLPLLILASLLLLGSGDAVRKQKDSQEEMIRHRREFDRAKKEEVLRKVRSFIQEINGELSGESDTNLDLPLDADDMEGTRPQDHNHAPGPFHETARGEILIPALLFDSASPGSEVVGRVGRGEEVDILARTRNEDNTQKREWFLVRKINGEEGWVREDHLRRLPAKREVFIVPARGPLSSRFGYRVHPVTKKKYSFHKGIDIAAPRGSPVRASSGGKVIRSEFNRNGYGNLVVIQHEKDLTTWYGHLEKRSVRKGDAIRQGDLLGTVGSTGRATGPHLHFEVRRGNTALDPEAWIH